MKPSRIFIVRHGQSIGNLDQKTHETVPDYKINLTNLGESQAVLAGEILKECIGTARVAFYTSPYARTRQTLAGIQTHFKLNNQIERTREDPRLREQEWGHLRAAEATHTIDRERQEYGTFFFRIPDGESGADVYDRASGFLDTLYRDFEQTYYPETAVIVTHGFTLRILLMRWLHWSIEDFHNLENPKNCAIFELKRDDSSEGRGRYQLITPVAKRSERTGTRE